MKNKIIILFGILLITSCCKAKEIYANSKPSLYNLDKIDTTITIYYPTGEPRYIQNYNILGDLTGNWTNYYKNGQIKQQGYYSNGQANGNWKYYNEDGSFKNEEFIKLDTNCVKFVALWDSETIANELGKSKKWVFLNYTVDVWNVNSFSENKKTKVTQLRASSYAELLGFNGEDYFIKAPMTNKTGWINKSHVKGFALKNKLTKKLCD